MSIYRFICYFIRCILLYFDNAHALVGDTHFKQELMSYFLQCPTLNKVFLFLIVSNLTESRLPYNVVSQQVCILMYRLYQHTHSVNTCCALMPCTFDKLVKSKQEYVRAQWGYCGHGCTTYWKPPVYELLTWQALQKLDFLPFHSDHIHSSPTPFAD